MAIDVEELRAKLRLDASGFDAGMKKSQQSLTDFGGHIETARTKLENLGKSMRDVGKNLTLKVTAPLVGAGIAVVKWASDQEEAISAVNTVYGENAEAIQDWSKTTARSMGIAREDALGAATQFAVLGKEGALAGDDLVGFSTDIVQAAADLGSFYNVDPGTVLQDLKSGLAGESEPLRKYGIFLTEAAVAQRAMEMTGKSNAKQLTAGEKILARNALIMESLGDASGDFDRTSTGLANTMRILKARFKDIGATIGKILLPFVLKGANAIGKLFDRFEKISPKMQKFILIAAGIAAAIGPVIYLLGFFAGAIAILLSPIGLLIAGGAVLVALFGNDLVRSFGSIIGYLKTFITVMKLAYDNTFAVKDLVEFLPAPLQRFERGFLLIANAVGHLVRAFKAHGLSGLLEVLPRELDNVWTAIKQFASGVASIALNFIFDTAVSIGGWLWDHKDDIWGGVKGLIGWTADTIEAAVRVVIDGAMALGGYLATVARNFGAWLKPELIGAGNKAVDIGTVTINASLRLASDIDWSGIRNSIGLGLVKSVRDAAYAFSPADTFAFGQRLGDAIGPALQTAVSKAFNAFKSDPVGSAILAAKIVAGIAAIFLAPLIIATALTAALAVWVGAAIVGLIDRIGASFGINFKGVATAIGTAITDGIATLADWSDKLVTKGKELLQGLKDGADETFAEIWAWVVARPGVIHTGIGDVTKTLFDKGVDLLQGLWNGAERVWLKLGQWITAIPSKVLIYIGDLGKTLYDKGEDLINGFRIGISSKWDAIREFFAGGGNAASLAQKIVGFVGSLGNTLYQAGLDLMGGLADGIYAAWGAVQSALSDIWGRIPDWFKKLSGAGSPAKNAMPLGQWVTWGIAEGVLQGMPRLNASLEQVANRALMPLGSGSISMGYSGMADVGGGNAGVSNTYQFGDIIVQGYNKDPKELADEISRIQTRELHLAMGMA